MKPAGEACAAGPAKQPRIDREVRLLFKLFEPIAIGPVSLRNRVVMPAVNLNYTPGGEVTDRFVEFYRARARGGVGLIVVGGAEIDDEASGRDLMLSIKDDRYVPGLRRFTEAVHREGAKTAVQLFMAGAYSYCGEKGLPTLAPSEYFSHYSRRQTTAMTLDQIARVQDDYARATRRARGAGFDAVEVLASAGYLICQFLSPKTNNRTDAYGGPLENRMRFGLETIRRVRDEAGSDMAVVVRVAGNDFVPGSHTNKESRTFAAAAEDAGADCIDVTGGWHESQVPQITMDLPRAGYAYLAAGIKGSVGVPVIACNRINDPFVAEDLLQEGVADLVGVARGLIADPDFVRKAREGRADLIRRCVACNQKCFDHVVLRVPVGCAINPRAGRETGPSIDGTEQPKKILVVGAGPAGCEFAVSAALRGHDVAIYEREHDIGGQVAWFAGPTRKHDYGHLLQYYRAMLPEYGVKLQTGVEVTPALVAQENPDLVVVATGAAPTCPQIGLEGIPHVVQARDVLRGAVQTGANVVVVGGGTVGLETALFLATIGTISPEQLYFLTLHEAESPDVLRDLMLNGVKKITVIEMGPKMAADVGRSTRWVLLKELALRGVKLITDAKLQRVSDDKVVYTDPSGLAMELSADTVVIATGSRPENSLAEELSQAGRQVLIVGDAKRCGRIGDAIDDAWTLASTV